MREITSHKVGDCRLDLQAIDEPGQGGANHVYTLSWFEERAPEVHVRHRRICYISFQNGPINEVGNNGITNEALLAIVIDRLEGFQSGKFKCRDNAIVLTKLEEAMMRLQKRTRDRMARGVEGTSTI
jgi:hypothetical protein